ncbi:MAG: hypothetical protein AB1481_02660 [Candidatus Omnitrophota bacterium]
MRKFLFILIAIISLTQFSFAQEEITITTYYPSPFGVYNKLRVFPHAAEPASECDSQEEEGVFYYNSDVNKWVGCKEVDVGVYGWQSISSHWVPLVNAGLPDDLFNSNPLGNIGIGPGFGPSPKIQPAAKLHVINSSVDEAANVVRLDGNGMTIHPVYAPTIDTPANFIIRGPMSATNPTDSAYMAFRKTDSTRADWVFIAPRLVNGGLVVNNDGRVGLVTDYANPTSQLIPTQKLTVVGNTAIQGTLNVYQPGTANPGFINTAPAGTLCGICNTALATPSVAGCFTVNNICTSDCPAPAWVKRTIAPGITSCVKN